MKYRALKCIDVDCTEDLGGFGLTEGKIYHPIGQRFGGHYNIMCDDGVVRSKLTIRFEIVLVEED